MLVARSNRFVLNNHKEGEEETLARMAKDGNQIEDVEEGEISDSASIEEISEEDFNKQEAKVSKETSKPKGSDARVWTMRDLYKYPMCRGYATGLYNFAWAQAVQNKPLNEIFVMDVEADENTKRSSSSTPMVDCLANSKEDKNAITAKEVSKVIIDVSGDEMDVKMEDVKEEGELEEGEIDLDSEPVEKAAEERVLNDSLSVSDSEIDSKERELEKRVNSIREALESVTVTDAEKSFERFCLRLQNSLKSLQEVVLENCVFQKDALIQLSYTAIQSLNSVFCFMNQNKKEQNKVIFLRLLSVVMSQDPPLFSCEQMKEIEVMMSPQDSPAVLLGTDISNKERAKLVTDGENQNASNALAENAGPASNALAENAGPDLNSSNKFLFDSVNVGSSLDKNNPNILSEVVKPGLYSLRGRGVLAPLLDLHKDHDADSLPSPTRETIPCFPVRKALAIGDGVAKPDLITARAAHEVEDSAMHPYETEALKAVSTYQQKFGGASFFSKDRLPSPTPSEECDDGDGDTSGEVSSSSTIVNVKNVNPPIFARPIVSSAPHTGVQGLVSARTAGPISSGSNPTLKTSKKSRDPRLRFAGSDVGALDINHRPSPVVYNAPKVEPLGVITSSRKNKTVEEPILDGPALKRQRNGLTNSDVVTDVKTVSGSGGWLEDTGTVGPQFMNRNQLIEHTGNNPQKMETGVSSPSTASGESNVITSGNEQVPLTGITTIAPLPALFKDIAVNPTILLNLLKMGQQQRLAAEVQQKPGDTAKSTMHPPSSNSILGAVPLGNVSPINLPGLGQKQAGTLQVPSQIAPMNLQDDLGKIRMKPRDPRRILHSNTFQKSVSLGSEQFKTNGAPTLSTHGSKDNVNAQKLEDQADKKVMPSHPVAPPDIAPQFTKNLKNIADILNIPQPTTTPTVASPILSQQVNSDRADVKATVSDSDEPRTGTGSMQEEGVAGTSRPQNTWGDVEHLFEGFDDQQRAAIQRERARRIEEQKKMFAARKLCLVLDLDHTLLNSAKFVEVDPVHDEILRKKEEQDREKPYRHLFRFPHMGMWTKLRPGIWNFLEKASNLYELHLYTMGNKLYATEMAKVLDPKGVLFAGRVISRGDDGDLFDGDERVPKSKDLEGVLGMESAVVIIDDSVRVWPHNKLNLIVVERYTYFPCSRRQFGLPGPSLLEIDHDERPEDGTLASSLAVIERMHEIFFSHRALDEVDVRNLLASEQQKILAGCRIVFSRVFPVGEANPHLHPLWQTAEQFGAVCTNQIDEQVTHVVANSLGTDKVNWALSTGRFVVHPGWVEASALLYRRANEQDFAIKP